MSRGTTKAGPVRLRPEPITMKADQLVAFLYDLARDELPAGRLERLVLESEKIIRRDEVRFSNRHLAAYAVELSRRLRVAGEAAVSPDDLRAEKETRDELVSDLVAMVAQWRALALSGTNPEAGKALDGAADALFGLLEKRGLA